MKGLTVVNDVVSYINGKKVIVLREIGQSFGELVELFLCPGWFLLMISISASRLDATRFTGRGGLLEWEKSKKV